ncbi:MAG: MaoC family dehydratase N-terminal domain-containing protein [Alphaproteobacteria bacterium]|nr:MaoC family dehydratase N-terminal domain-containing protein [Alphaproteobacteria bacterium]
MAINYEHIMSLKSEGTENSYTDKETMLYALGIGFGRDPFNEDELRFVYEGVNDPKYLKTVPTMATVLQWGGGAMQGSGINYLMVVHGEQRVTLHRPLPTSGTIISDERIIGAFDKGAGKGAVIVSEKKIRLKGTNEPLVTLVSSTFARGDGGFGGPSAGAPEPHPIPERKPDETFEASILKDQAFVYALSGDRNPLHRDPKIAKAAGFPAPIIHGLCTYGTTCRAIITNVLNYDAAKITGYDVRFSSPVFPGETVLLDVWKDGNVISFRARLKERDVVAINNGKCTLAA